MLASFSDPSPPAMARAGGGVGAHPTVRVAPAESPGAAPEARLTSRAPGDYSGGMERGATGGSQFPLTWRIDRRCGLDSATARAMRTWLEDHVRSIEAEGLTGPSNVSAAPEGATTEGRHLLDQLEAEFPAGTGPVMDADAQEAVRRIVGRLRRNAVCVRPDPGGPCESLKEVRHGQGDASDGSSEGPRAVDEGTSEHVAPGGRGHVPSP